MLLFIKADKPFFEVSKKLEFIEAKASKLIKQIINEEEKIRGTKKRVKLKFKGRKSYHPKEATLCVSLWDPICHRQALPN